MSAAELARLWRYPQGSLARAKQQALLDGARQIRAAALSGLLSRRTKPGAADSAEPERLAQALTFQVLEKAVVGLRSQGLAPVVVREVVALEFDPLEGDGFLAPVVAAMADDLAVDMIRRCVKAIAGSDHNDGGAGDRGI